MKVTVSLILGIFLVAGCYANKNNHDVYGNLDQECNKDGTCNAPTLRCKECVGCITKGYVCVPTDPARPEPTCRGSEDCFCKGCTDRCSDAGVKNCAYSDTSVWGSKPAVCECK